MTTSGGGDEEVSRSERRRLILRGLLRGIIASVLLVALYFLIPVDWIRGLSLGFVLIAAPVLLIGVTILQVTAIIRSDRPGLRAIEALGIIAPLYLLLFAVTYFLMALDDPANFSADALTRLDALYFTTTVFATVGFGDITPVSQISRLLVTIQMVLNLIILGAGIRLLTVAVNRGREEKVKRSVQPAQPES